MKKPVKCIEENKLLNHEERNQSEKPLSRLKKALSPYIEESPKKN